MAVALLLFCGTTAWAWEMTKVNISTPWAADVTPENVHREYPRPQMVRNDWQNLNGLWQWQSLKSIDQDLSSTWKEILVPFAPEAPLSGIGRHYESMAYSRSLVVPEAWEGKRVLLHFEAVDWRCEAFVDGLSVGTHEGGYDPFTFDITEALKQGGGGVKEHELILRVFDPTDNDAVPRGKQVLSPGGIFYTPTSGIWQTVWMEAVPQSYIADYRVETDIDKGTVTFSLLTGGGDIADGTTFSVVVRHGSDVVAEGTAEVGKKLSLSIPDAELWEPEHPFLYDARLTMGDDAVDTYFGMRKISLQRDGSWYRLALNNQFLFQMGPLDQGFWPDGVYTAPSDEALLNDIVTMKRMGFNMVRKHIKVEPRRWYYWCDRLGLLVWQDMPGENYGGKGGVENNPDYFNRELTALVETHYNTPSIVMWVIFNEGGGQGGKDYTNRFVNLVRRLDKTRLINEASGWNHYGYGDVKDIHPYPAPTYTTTTGKQATACGEYGGVQYVLDGHLWSSDHWGYASVESPEELDNTYTEYARKLAYYKTFKGLSAAVYTQLTDVEVEVNGLMSYDRVVKSDLSRLYAANRLAIESEGQPLTYLLKPADEEGETWRYTTTPPSTPTWYAPDFDDSAWQTGKAGFGANGLANMHYGTRWTTTGIWIRRTIDLDLTPEELARLVMRIYYDEDTEVYINGKLAFSATGYITDYKNVAINASALAAIDPHGTNTLAAHCKQTAGGQFLDIALFVDNATPVSSATQAVRATMEYDRSSELSFTLGCAQNTSADVPEFTQTVTRLPLASAPATPAIGLDDARLVGAQDLLFDVSPLLSKVDATKPVKIFFRVNTTKRGRGSGTVHGARYEDSTTEATLVAPFTPVTTCVKGGSDSEWMTAVFDPSTAAPAPVDTIPAGTDHLGFDVTPAAVLKGDKVFLQNKAELAPSLVAWEVEGGGKRILIAGGNTSFVPEVAGVYTVSQQDVSTGARLTRPAAFTVSNAPSGNGWSFREGAYVRMASPLTARSYKYTFDWWMRPEGDTDGCYTVYDVNREQFLLTVGADGVMTVTSGRTTAVSPAAYVVSGEWHHYALVYYYSRYYFYRDGVLIHNTAAPSNTPAWEEGLIIDGRHCVIDEWRFWGNRLTQDRLCEVCVAPLADPAAEAASASALAVYIDFDTTDPVMGTVNVARPSEHISLSRGGAWVPSLGIFCLDFNKNAGKEKPVDVTANYLTNYRAPFAHTADGACDDYAWRYKGLEMGTASSLWEAPEGYPGLISVDTQRSDALLIQNGWFGPTEPFASRALLQTVTLPAGTYTFSASLAEASACWQSVLQVWGHDEPLVVLAPLTDGSVTFTLLHDGKVTLGIGIVLGAYGRVVVDAFKLVRHPMAVLSANGEEPTAIVPAEAAAPSPSGIYDLQGIRLDRPDVPGILIHNGRKILIK